MKRFLLLVAVTSWPVGCGGSSGVDVTAYSADAAGLDSLFTDLRAALKSNDRATAGALSMSLLPDESAVATALDDDAVEPRRTIAALFVAARPPSEALAAHMFSDNPEYTQINVHGATTEEIAAREPGTVAADEFPGGAQTAAETILRPRMTFYEVEFVEPGHGRGLKFHLFFHDGRQWRMLGPAWRRDER